MYFSRSYTLQLVLLITDETFAVYNASKIASSFSIENYTSKAIYYLWASLSQRLEFSSKYGYEHDLSTLVQFCVALLKFLYVSF